MEKKVYQKPEVVEHIIASQFNLLTGSQEQSSIGFDDGYSTVPDGNDIDL